jgi:hypothetical protein
MRVIRIESVLWEPSDLKSNPLGAAAGRTDVA